jgi:hypothetical protein
MPWTKVGYWIAPDDTIGPELASERVAREYARDLNAKHNSESFDVRRSQRDKRFFEVYRRA